MKLSAARRILCVLIGASTLVAASGAKATTPRYSIDEEKLESSNLPLKIKTLANLTYVLQNVDAVSSNYSENLANAMLFPFYRSRSLKQKKIAVNKAPSGVKTVSLVNNARPKVKYKAKPMVKIPQINVQTKKGNSVKNRTENKTNLSHFPIKIINNSNVRRYKNGTKFRIKSSNKQADGISEINPVISTYSPEFPIGGVPTFPVDTSTLNNNPLQINPDIYTYSQQNPLQSAATPISQVVLQSIPAGNSNLNPADCPTFLISSNVYGPQRQGCSDLNLVVNNYDQNIIPSQALAADPVQADEPAVEAPAEVAAEPAAEAAAPAAAPAADPPSSGGGLPQLPQLPGLPELGLPDLKGLFDLLGQLWRILQWIFGLFGFLTNPYLYLVPAGISFALGFLKILGAFKLFVLLPALLLFGYVNRDKPPEIAYYDHIHEPIHHDDGWFWNQNTKTWTNVGDLVHRKNSRIPKALDDLPSSVYKEND